MEIDIFFVILGLFIGFMVVYIISPPPRVVIKYPTLDNMYDTTYVDENNVPYVYKLKKCNS
jgi:hypothetical protein